MKLVVVDRVCRTGYDNAVVPVAIGSSRFPASGQNRCVEDQNGVGDDRILLAHRHREACWLSVVPSAFRRVFGRSHGAGSRNQRTGGPQCQGEIRIYLSDRVFRL